MPAAREPSTAATPLPSQSASTAPPPALSPDVGYLGRLTRYCDLGACCPAVDVDGTLYSLRLPDVYRWRPTGNGHAIRDREQTADIATEGDTILVRGRERGPDYCFATGLAHSIKVEDVARAYVGGVLETGVCLVLSSEDEVLEMKFPDGWDYDRVDDRLVVRDDQGNVVMGEGESAAVIARPEREATGSFCMVGDDTIRVARIVAVWD